MADTQQPPNPSRRKLFSWLVDRDQAGQIGAEAGKIVRQAKEIAEELSGVTQETAAALTEPLAPEPDPIPAANADLAAEAERLGEAIAAVQAEAATDTQPAVELQPEPVAPDKTIAAPLQQQIEIAGQLRTLQRTLDERLPQAQSDVERSHLEWLSDQTKHLVTLFIGATGAALYEALVNDQVYEPLKAWVKAQTEASSVQAQPASPVQTPEAAPKRTISGDQVRRLRAVMQDRNRPAQERLEAGLQLSDLGVLPEGLDDFIAVPGTDFRIGKYPVTYFQFRRFVAAGGYGVKGGWRTPWWSEAGWKRRLRGDWTAPRYWDNEKRNRATQPVVGVSWYEAAAYCAWLNHTASHAHLPGGGRYLPAGGRAQLPTQEEWMLAARNGRRQAPAEEVDYPWGGVFDPALANTKESGLLQPTPVDMYPDGATSAGVYDLSGNVLEWTSGRNEESTSEVWWLKGGSWWNGARDARASAAGGIDIGYSWGDYHGFRVVVVSTSRSG